MDAPRRGWERENSARLYGLGPVLYQFSSCFPFQSVKCTRFVSNLFLSDAPVWTSPPGPWAQARHSLPGPLVHPDFLMTSEAWILVSTLWSLRYVTEGYKAMRMLVTSPIKRVNGIFAPHFKITFPFHKQKENLFNLDIERILNQPSKTKTKAICKFSSPGLHLFFLRY